MGLRKRPYNEDKKGGKNDSKKSFRSPRSSGDSKGEFKSGPVKRTYKKGEGQDGSFKRAGSSGEKGTPAKRTYKSSGSGFDRKPKRFDDQDNERRTPAKRAAGNTRNNGAFDRRPNLFGDDNRRAPVKRAGGYKRNEESGSRRSSSFGADKSRPGDRGGRRMDKTGFEENGFEQRPKTSRSGKSYMVKGAKARDVKAKSDEMMEMLNPEEIRLNRYISNSGICSRREADDLIAAGLVAVNGTIITEMGYKVKPGDEVRYNNERLSWEKKVYLIMNKPKDSITTSDDPDGRRIIMDLIKDPRLPRVYPVGRLDRNTTGVILLTNDGELAQRLTHPKYNITKVYKATLNKNFAAKDLQELGNNGVELEDGPIKPDVVGIPSASEKDVVLVQIHSGRNRIIHRMFEAMGYLVDKLDRIDFAGLERKGLDRGEWRHLDDKEIKKLKKLVQLK